METFTYPKRLGRSQNELYIEMVGRRRYGISPRATKRLISTEVGEAKPVLSSTDQLLNSGTMSALLFYVRRRLRV